MQKVKEKIVKALIVLVPSLFVAYVQPTFNGARVGLPIKVVYLKLFMSVYLIKSGTKWSFEKIGKVMIVDDDEE